MPRLKVRNLGYMLVVIVFLLLYYNALVPRKDYNHDDSDELVDRWIEKKLNTIHERDKRDPEVIAPGPDKASGPLLPPKQGPPPKQQQKNRGAPKVNKKSPVVKVPPKKASGAKSQQKKQETKEAWMARMYMVQSQRKAHLRGLCDGELGRPLKPMEVLGSTPKQLRPLIVNDRHQFIYSIVYKVGSTNWERVIVEDLEGFKNVPNQKLFSHKALRWMPGFKPLEAKERLRNYTKFIFVRNPLSRILSAYRDKFVDHHNPVFSKIAKTIIGKFRTGPYNASAIDVTLTEFLRYLVNNTNHRSNPHWKVIYNQNYPCELSYDIIGKLEEAQDDIPFVLERIGIRNLTSYGSNEMKRKGSDEQLWSRYFSEVPKEVMTNFYEIYKQDFTLFGYKMPSSF